MANARHSFYRPELDVIRFGAFLLVFLHHGFPLTAEEYRVWGVPESLGALFASAARAGALGVDLFFALSAYLITELLLREQRARGSFDIRAFYLRRILRIWPLYYFALLALVPLVSIILLHESMPQTFFFAFLLFGGNWVPAWWGVYPTSFALLWSVSVEEQFYIAWPWLLRIFGRRLSLCALAMVAVATMTRAILIANHASLASIWANTLARLDPIAGGALLAVLLQGGIPQNTRRARILWIIGGGASLWAAGSVLKEPSTWLWLVTYPLAAAASVAMIFGSFAPGPRREPGRLVRAVMYLGKISYGLYVLHFAAIRVVQTVAGPSLRGPGVLLISFLLTVALAAVSYRYLESPFLRWKKRFTHITSRAV